MSTLLSSAIEARDFLDSLLNLSDINEIHDLLLNEGEGVRDSLTEAIANAASSSYGG